MIVMSHSGKWTKQSKYPTVSIWHVQWNWPHGNIEQVFGKLKLDLIGSFEGTRAIVCTKKEERSDQRRSSQRLRYLRFHTIHNYCNADLPRPFWWGVWARGRDWPRGWRERIWGDKYSVKELYVCLVMSIPGHLTIWSQVPPNSVLVLDWYQDNEGASNSAEEDGEAEELDEEGIPHLLYNNSEDSDPGLPKKLKFEIGW